MDAIILFSGGKDSILGLEKARKNGLNVVGAVHITFISTLPDEIKDVPTSVVSAIASSVGIPDFESVGIPVKDMVGFGTTQLWQRAIKKLRDRHPNADTLIVSADGSQIANMQLFYCRLAHSLNLSVYIPYMHDYDASFISDMKEAELEIRMFNYLKSAEKPPYEIGEIIPLEDFEAAYNTNQFNIYSGIQSIVTNGKMFSSPIRTVVDDAGFIQLQ